MGRGEFPAEGRAANTACWCRAAGLEHFLDLFMDAKDAEAGLTGGTPRTIEGPLYVAGAPLSRKVTSISPRIPTRPAVST